MGYIVKIFGYVVVAIGGILVFGNVTGAFSTFPYAGFIAMMIGGGLITYGQKLEQEEFQKELKRLENSAFQQALMQSGNTKDAILDFLNKNQEGKKKEDKSQ